MIYVVNKAVKLYFKAFEITTDTLDVEILDFEYTPITMKTAEKIDDFIYVASHAFLEEGIHFSRFTNVRGLKTYTKYEVIPKSIPSYFQRLDNILVDR